MKRPSLAVLAACVVLAFASTTFAESITLVDRGLPTANLNNAAGANRSNVAWAFSTYTSANYWLVGDTFTNTSASTWYIDTITMWTVGNTETAILRGGTDTSTIGIITDATYPGATLEKLYQGSSGSYITMHQIDFKVNVTLAAGQTYYFFLDGSGAEAGIVVPFAHASNAALSGSNQEGADDLMLFAHVLDGVVATDSVGTWTSLGDGWDKASDLNVVVKGTVPDGGSTLVLLGSALVGLGAIRRRFRGRQ
jgi:hypothetical protein